MVSPKKAVIKQTKKLEKETIKELKLLIKAEKSISSIKLKPKSLKTDFKKAINAEKFVEKSLEETKKTEAIARDLRKRLIVAYGRNNLMSHEQKILDVAESLEPILISIIKHIKQLQKFLASLNASSSEHNITITKKEVVIVLEALREVIVACEWLEKSEIWLEGAERNKKSF